MFKKSVLIFMSLIFVSLNVFAHPGRTDKNGGHVVSTDGWGYEIGTYHYHDKKYEKIVPVDKDSGKALGITVIVKGETVIFDQPPVIIDGRTLVPVRFVVEKLGYNVEWDGETRSVYIKNGDFTNADVEDSHLKVLVNNELVNFDVPPVVLNGRTLIPIRAVAEKIGCTVEWDGDLQVVYIE